MGPQPFGCGRTERAHMGDVNRLASMGPQPFGCGRGEGRMATKYRLQLQWGRNLSVAEGPLRPSRSGHVSIQLQWGRNLSVAEGG